MRNKIKFYSIFPPPLPSSWAQLYSWILYLLIPSSAGGQGMGVVVSSSHVVSAAFSSTGGGLLTHFPCSNVGSLPCETVLHKLLQCESFPRAAGLHKLLHCGSLPQAAAFQEQTTPVWVHHGITSPASKPALGWDPLSPWVHRSCQEPAAARTPHGVTTSFRHPPAPLWGPLCAAGGDLLHRGPPWATGGQPASPWSSPQAAGESLLRYLEHLLPLLLHWPWCLQSCFSHIFSLLFPAAIYTPFPSS